MKNEDIIFSNRIELMKKGVIGKTGKLIPVEDEQGNKKFIEEPEQIHTYAEWKRRGFTVRHGEKAVSQFPIWKRSNKANEERSDASGNMFMKKAFFFKQSQVEPTEEIAAVG
ncbi:hypothetical protein [Butyrivibrio sp. FC2001]|uniref:hypothetical protein n=1 Tax=Butyrivibrio sp. FC2001 TaxID=1280671 RepID=UPI0003FD50FF|nr:hypothetical protein [Butyrivibrio sp. FC2001]